MTDGDESVDAADDELPREVTLCDIIGVKWSKTRDVMYAISCMKTRDLMVSDHTVFVIT